MTDDADKASSAGPDAAGPASPTNPAPAAAPDAVGSDAAAPAAATASTSADSSGSADRAPEKKKEESVSSTLASGWSMWMSATKPMTQYASYAARSAEQAFASGAASISAAIDDMDKEKKRRATLERELHRGEKPESLPPSAEALERLRSLHALGGVKSPDYEPFLEEFWSLLSARPFERRGDEWKSHFGFSTENPDDDMRAGGMLALKSLSYFATRHLKQARLAVESGAPLGAAGVAISRELARLCDIGSPLGVVPRSRPFWGALEHPDGYFELFSICVAVWRREWNEGEGRRFNARLAASVRAATRELETLLDQGPKSYKELQLLATCVPGSPQHEQLAEMARVASKD